jgi:hypothetical protein
MERWKHLVVKVKPGFLGEVDLDKMQGELDRHGALGWELVNTLQHPMRGIYLFFKRPQ